MANLVCWAAERDTSKLNAVVVTFSRPLSPSELSFFRECCARSAPLMDERWRDAPAPNQAAAGKDSE